ncbi:glycosyltransferase involved in cell wall biosynthesis [Asanoa ferruginea]|uniref:Glycosyltransferase involved in cell wall biosynthesis n=1 Tax=Asanoa ferruginea TaxID=53367 RepID=A0A3D9ZQM2_9ACTN|nr:glycosyltransferase [Asanoa ferruginea]REF99535.1 glycosyltransferase involved in cell wall biosynthesis [Asanoa ferruginea]GIF49473.1 hypothetical protein Afe04nite_40120 [Asanoa ferruginea]
MTDVLLVAGAVPTRPTVLVEALTKLRERGAKVYLACDFDPGRLGGAAELAEIRRLGTAKGPVFSNLVRGATPPVKVWLRASRDRWVREHARSAEVIVALDNNAVHTVWQLAHRNRRADAVFGLTPALKAVDDRLANPIRPGWRAALPSAPSPRLVASDAARRAGAVARLAGLVATGSRAMRIRPVRKMWAVAAAAPGVPERRRAALARRLQASMLNAGQPGSALAMAERVVPLVTDPRTRAELLGPAADRDLAAGRVPASLHDVVEGELARAELLRAGTHPIKAPPVVGRAFDLLFHRVLHFDSLSSPLSDDPEQFLAPLHESAIGRRFASPSGRGAKAEPATGRPPRALFLTGLNDNFLTPIRERYEAMPEVETRSLDMSPGTPVRTFLNNGRAKLIAHRLMGDSKYAREAQELFGPGLEWADTVFVDWCAVPAGLLSLVDPGTTRVVVRLHSFEAFTWWPHLVDFSRVDDLVFVSDHLRDLVVAAVPRLRGPDAPRLHVLTNAMDLRAYPAEKTPDARFTLGLVGISAIAKDPRWAIEVLRLLRAHDERYNLVLVGKEPSADVSAAAKAYCTAFEREVVELEAQGAVRRLGQRDDVPKVLTEVGVILSTSVRESFHCALVEGAASGAVPVVRDWPFFAGRAHSARTVFPDDWVVGTPAEAAARILELTATDDGWREAGRAAAEHALATWDWSVVQPTYDPLFLPPISST